MYKLSAKWWLGIASAGVIVGSVALNSFLERERASQPPYVQTASSSVDQIPQPTVGLPVHLKIPSISVDALFEYVGLTAQGDMDIPKGPDSVAWYNLGPRPGEKGSAVIAGHEGWKNAIPAVFDDLATLHPGDKVYVEDERGVITTFVVRELKVYGRVQNAAEVFESNDGKAHLNLVTCQGIWNEAKKSYANRLVVFTDKE